MVKWCGLEGFFEGVGPFDLCIEEFEAGCEWVLREWGGSGDVVEVGGCANYVVFDGRWGCSVRGKYVICEGEAEASIRG